MTTPRHARPAWIHLFDGAELLVRPVEQSVGGFEAVWTEDIGGARNDVHGTRPIGVGPDHVSTGAVCGSPIDFNLRRRAEKGVL